MQVNNEKTLNAVVAKQGREEGNQNTYEGDPMTKSLRENSKKFPAAFSIATTHARVYIEPDDDYCETYGIKADQRVLDTAGMLRLDTGDDVVFLSPAEALSVSAALSAVAVHLMESAELEREAA